MRAAPAGRLSVQATLALAAGVFSLVVLSAIGVLADVAIRAAIERGVFEETERAATDWIGSMTTRRPSPPVTASDVDLMQLVDSSGNVVSASRAAAGRPPLSAFWPRSEDRIEHRTECSPAGCVMFTATRPSPQEEQVLWGGESHVVYAGRMQPEILATHRLELFLGAGVLAASALMVGVAWVLTGLALRPVEAMRRRLAEVTVTDLSLRIPEPHGSDEFARLARTANVTLARLQAAVEQQRNFCSMVSHELRTPLTGIRTQLEEALLYREVDPHQAIRDALGTADRCQSIIDEMLMLARVRAAPHGAERVDLAELVRGEAAARRSGVPVRGRVEEGAEGVRVRGNTVQICEVLVNLMANGQRHARSGVEVSLARVDGQAVVTVLDDGDGIAEADRERVFQPFVRLAEAHRRDPKGSGLGLAISRAIAEAHQGSLKVGDSEAGAAFVLRLPLADAD